MGEEGIDRTVEGDLFGRSRKDLDFKFYGPFWGFRFEIFGISFLKCGPTATDRSNHALHCRNMYATAVEFIPFVLFSFFLNFCTCF